MKHQMIRWQPIREQYMYGWTASIDNRTAEVVRAYNGQWLAFLKIDNQMCKRMPGEHEYMTYSTAKAFAARFLRSEFTPEVWRKVTEQ